MSDTDPFLHTLAPDGPFTFQTFADDATRKDARLARILHGNHDQHAEALAALNGSGAGVFVMVNAGDGRGRKAANVQRVRALFLDIDEGGPGVLKQVLVAAKRGRAAVGSGEVERLGGQGQS